MNNPMPDTDPSAIFSPRERFKSGNPEFQALLEQDSKPDPHFPNHLLPWPVREYVEQASGALGCDPAYVAVPMLAALASAIGNTRRIRLKPSWTEPAVIWAVVVGDSGTSKAPRWNSPSAPSGNTRRPSSTTMPHLPPNIKPP
jgi:hypothetical protein